MLCAKCRGLSRRRSAGGQAPGDQRYWRRAPFLACDICGALLPQADSTSIMLAMLTRLAGFGLGSLDRPLLTAGRAGPGRVRGQR